MQKARLFALFFSLISSISLYALDASVSYATFKSPHQNYVEVYLHVIGSTITFTKVDSVNSQAAVEVLLLIKKGDQIIKFDKYRLSSPAGKTVTDFIDLKRFALADGEYTLEVNFKDVSDSTNTREISKSLAMNYGGSGLHQSDIELLASASVAKDDNLLVKNGYFLEPLPFSFYDKRKSQLIFYNEVYNTDEKIGEPFLARYLVEEVKNDGSTKTAIIANKKLQPRPVSVILAQLDINKLPTGNYHLIVEIRNRNNELLSERKVFFQRANPFLELEKIAEEPLEDTFTDTMSAESLRYSLRAIAMHVPDADVEVLNLMLERQDTNLVPERRYLFNFWAQQAPNGPKAAYHKYMEVARAVDNQFNSGFRAGFESDRGWLYMKYGRPDDIITEENELNAPPYEIWVYYELKRTRERNVKFLFYNPTLATGGYQLLHSTSRYELQNANWEQELYRDSPQPLAGSNSVDGNSMSFTKRAKEYFNDL